MRSHSHAADRKVSLIQWGLRVKETTKGFGDHILAPKSWRLNPICARHSHTPPWAALPGLGASIWRHNKTMAIALSFGAPPPQAKEGITYHPDDSDHRELEQLL